LRRCCDPFRHSLPGIGTTEEISPALRADAARNRQRILAAAAAVFAERGLDASTAEIARRAGVGEATLFRRFPTKDDLIVAIIAEQMDAVIALAEDALAQPDPWRAVERFFLALAEKQVNDRGAFDAAKEECLTSATLAARRRRVMDLVAHLVRRGQEADVVRHDLTAPDLAMLAHAASAVAGVAFPGLRDDLWKRYLGVILDGIRPEGATKLRPGPPPRRLFDDPPV
jgi:AcrR family transcriptional regulator